MSYISATQVSPALKASASGSYTRSTGVSHHQWKFSKDQWRRFSMASLKFLEKGTHPNSKRQPLPTFSCWITGFLDRKWYKNCAKSYVFFKRRSFAKPLSPGPDAATAFGNLCDSHPRMPTYTNILISLSHLGRLIPIWTWRWKPEPRGFKIKPPKSSKYGVDFHPLRDLILTPSFRSFRSFRSSSKVLGIIPQKFPAAVKVRMKCTECGPNDSQPCQPCQSCQSILHGRNLLCLVQSHKSKVMSPFFVDWAIPMCP